MLTTIRKQVTFVLPALLLCLPVTAGEAKEIEFESADGLLITADLYQVSKDKRTPFIVLFHQAGWSRGEYLEIAPRLNEMGYNCMAVDARSGGTINEVKNATLARAEKKELGTTFVDALPDLVASLEHARKIYAQGKLIAWGSSYSSALVLKVAGDHTKLVDGVLSFAPGEYFERFGKPSTWIAASAKNIKCPAFITSATKERQNWQPIFDAIPKGKKHFYLPDTAGQHGSRALWEKFDDNGGYWEAVEVFLEGSFPVEFEKKD
ncbi:MAG: dienelactone hydrolase [Candidatus Paceibacteria bacterium]|jgi:dienelactone hydrolase